MNKETKKKTILDLATKMSGKQKIASVGLISLLTIGALGAMNEYSGSQKGIISSLAEKVGLTKEIPSTESLQPQTATPQLSKEYIYAGSRQLAVEDYGIAQPNPTPTP